MDEVSMNWFDEVRISLKRENLIPCQLKQKLHYELSGRLVRSGK